MPDNAVVVIDMREPVEIKKSLLDEYEVERLAFIKENFLAVGNVEYEGLTVDIRRCPNHENEFYIRIDGLGECLHMMYVITEGELTMMEFLMQSYRDFLNYVMINRDEDTHDTIH